LLKMTFQPSSWVTFFGGRRFSKVKMLMPAAMLSNFSGRNFGATTFSIMTLAILSIMAPDAEYPDHRDKTGVQMPAKIFPHLKVKC
jgi:hypothetical protein